VVSLLGGELASLPDIGYGGQLSAVNRVLVGQALRRADVITVGSRFLAELAGRHVDAGRVRVIPLGVDTRRFQRAPCGNPSPTLAGRPSLLNVASLSAVKDQDTLLRAFRRARTRLGAAHLHLVGEGDRRAPLERLAAELGVDRAVSFHGAVPHDRLAQYYRAADACVLSSRFESQAMVVLEAASCGCRTIGSAVGILPEIARRSALVGPRDPEALARVLASELGRPNGRLPHGDIGQDALDRDYGLPASVARFVGLYQSLSR